MFNRRAFLACPAALALTGPAARAATPMGRRLADFLVQVDEEDLALNPQAAVLRGDLRRAGEFGDLISDDYHAQVQGLLQAQLARFAGLRRSELNVPEQLAYDTWHWQARLALRSYTEGHVRLQRCLPLDHLFGQHISFAQFSSGTAGAPFRTVADYDAGLSRFSGFVRYLDGVVERLREGWASGCVLPRHIVRTIIRQLDDALSQPLDASPYLGPVAEAALPAAFDAAQRAHYVAAYRQAITDQVHPALGRLRAHLQGDYLAASRTGPPGVGALPGGARWYEHQLESHTTLRMSAAEIHRIGLAEVRRVRLQLSRLQDGLGVKGPLAALFQHLKEHPGYKFDSPEALLAAYEAVHQRVRPMLPRWFARLPRSPLALAAVPREQQASAGGAYYILGTPDGSRPGTFYVNTSELHTRTDVRTTTLFLHEALPGHHLQGSLALEDDTLPPLLRYGWNAGYGEGWALYAEQLGHEMGLYRGRPVQHLGQLDMEIFRAARLVVDTGLHTQGWSRDRAVDYLVANTSQERSFCETEVDRYTVWPGQACAYKLGELAIRRLRRQAQRALGPRFNLRGFHAQVLDTGALPLAVLQRKIDHWTRSLA